jgi:FlaA1/EpsC-like NDP-sugar epimerase
MERVFESYTDVVYHAAVYKHIPLMEENPLAVYTNVVERKKPRRPCD